MNRHNVHMMSVFGREDIIEQMDRIGADRTGIQIMAQKADFFHIYVSQIGLRAANILKQEMLSKGGDACLHMDVSKMAVDRSDCILFGSRRVFRKVIANMQLQPFGLKQLASELKTVFEAYDTRTGRIPEWATRLALPLKERTIVMGILNVTPDSFSDGGKYNQVEYAVQRAREMVAEGADILDIGGESTRPGAEPVGLEQELERVIPAIEAISKELSVPISIDTYKADVASRAIAAGAHIINDVWGGKKDHEMTKCAADHNVPIILMHNRQNIDYQQLLPDMISDLRESIEIALSNGVADDNIILDPGIGFAKDYHDNLEVMYRLRDICMLGYPVLLGTSRKSLIAKTLQLPVDERIEGTAATVAIGIERGVDIVRVHDVKEMKRVSMMTDAMVRR